MELRSNSHWRIKKLERNKTEDGDGGRRTGSIDGKEETKIRMRSSSREER